MSKVFIVYALPHIIARRCFVARSQVQSLRRKKHVELPVEGVAVAAKAIETRQARPTLGWEDRPASSCLKPSGFFTLLMRISIIRIELLQHVLPPYSQPPSLPFDLFVGMPLPLRIVPPLEMLTRKSRRSPKTHEHVRCNNDLCVYLFFVCL